MKFAIRNTVAAFSRFSNPNPKTRIPIFTLNHFSTLTLSNSSFRTASTTVSRYSSSSSSSSSTAPVNNSEPHPPSLPFTDTVMEKQFEDFRQNLQESGTLRDRLRAVAVEIESVTRLMQSNLLLVHQSRPLPEVLEKAKAKIVVLKDLYKRLADIHHEHPGQYHRYHGDWKSETQTVVSLLAFMHWLETENLLMHNEAQEKLDLNSSEFGLDVEDYLIGVCFMSNELPRYVVNKVTAGDYDTPRKVLGFLTDLHSAFRMLNLRNDFLRKKFDGMNYDLRKVEEVFYDVKIRGLAAPTTDAKVDVGVQS